MTITRRRRAVDGANGGEEGQRKGATKKRAKAPRKAPRADPLAWSEATATPLSNGGWRFTMPVVTSANRTWRTGKGRTYKAKQANSDTKAAAQAFARIVPMVGELSVSIVWHRAQRSGDVDNRIKGTLDLLRKIAYPDDASVARVSCERVDDGSPARLVVDVQPAHIRPCHTFST